ncbi:hypothetical protein ThidrDRAFT_4710, partial [Thiorhodococcus drewsii AZ1]
SAEREASGWMNARVTADRSSSGSKRVSAGPLRGLPARARASLRAGVGGAKHLRPPCVVATFSPSAPRGCTGRRGPCSATWRLAVHDESLGSCARSYAGGFPSAIRIPGCGLFRERWLCGPRALAPRGLGTKDSSVEADNHTGRNT